MNILRYVAIGDSFTEGVGDPAPQRPNGLRGWADRVAEVLAGRDPDFRYANLAIRGRKLRGVIDEQVAPALALRPDLITIYAGANDILRPKVDLDALTADYSEALGRLAASGARLLVFTAYDPGGSAIYRPMRGRFALYNELVREAAELHGATLIDYWRMRELRDWRMWDPDRMHMGPPGHQAMATRVLDTLGVPHQLRPLSLPTEVERTPLGRARHHVEWVRDSAGPWVHRRLTGRSSGDSVSARYPELGIPVTGAGASE